jgi:hypothetical protein
MDLRKENAPKGDDELTFWEKAKLILSNRAFILMLSAT